MNSETKRGRPAYSRRIGVSCCLLTILTSLSHSCPGEVFSRARWISSWAGIGLYCASPLDPGDVLHLSICCFVKLPLLPPGSARGSGSGA